MNVHYSIVYHELKRNRGRHHISITALPKSSVTNANDGWQAPQIQYREAKGNKKSLLVLMEQALFMN